MKEKILNAAIDHLKKSPVLQEVKVAADSLMDQLNKTFKHDPVSLDVLVSGLSDSTDQLIIDTERSDNLVFIGGELSACSAPQRPDTLSLKLKLYFNNPQDKILLKESEKQLDSSVLTSQALKDLNEKGIVTFEVDKPSR